jgi:hypothetical protein
MLCFEKHAGAFVRIVSSSVMEVFYILIGFRQLQDNKENLSNL